jgi:pimeloyl-ACP methyl ester carboxylesterase
MEKPMSVSNPAGRRLRAIAASRPAAFRSSLTLGLRGLGIAALAAALSACSGLSLGGLAGQDRAEARPPVVFVHGNGDTAGLWLTTLWRFESNGWPRERLHAIDAPNPLARDDDAVPQAHRTSAAEHAAFLAAEVDAVLARTGAKQVVLVGNSRGGNAIRTYLRNGNAAKVSHAILGGTPNHGVWARADFRPGNEFNGAGPVLMTLNAPQGPGGLEVTPGVKWMTLRSDGNDKFAQPTGEWIGRPGWATEVDARGPELKGADNRVLAGLDHREVSYHGKAFEQTYQFITGRMSARPIVSETQVILNGKVNGAAAGAPTNLPVAGATVRAHRVSCQTGVREGSPLLERTTAADGRWGPLQTDAATCLEFEYSAPGFATVHQYRSPFPRSSDVVHLRVAALSDADRKAGAVVSLVRPRGYFGLGRDTMSLDGKPLPGIAAGVAGLASAKLNLPAEAQRIVVGEFNGERIAMRTWPTAENRMVVGELHQ